MTLMPAVERGDRAPLGPVHAPTTAAGHEARDRVTGLWDRWGWDDRAAHLFENVRRQRQQVALLLMDVDRFKNVNDALGHAAGDAVLAIVADLLRTQAGPEGVVGRYADHGGDEFLILLPRVSRADAVCVAERIRAALRSHAFAVTATVGAVTLSGLTASIGVAAGISHTELTLADLVLRADGALRQAKRGGRDSVRTVGLVADGVTVQVGQSILEF